MPALCCLPSIVPAQGLTSARHVSERPAGRDQHQKTSAKALTGLLEELEQRYDVRFAFEDKLLKGLYVEEGSLRGFSSRDFEQALERLLQPLSLKCKKLKKGLYVIQPLGEIVSIEMLPEKHPELPDSDPAGPGENYELSVRDLVMDRLQDKTITGVVTDAESGEGLPGVSVVLKGTATGTATDMEGRFSLTIPDAEAGGTLQFSFVGYVSQEVNINGRESISVALNKDVAALEEVVVVGYGTQKKSDITGAVASVPLERMQMVPNLNIGQALQGSVPGVVFLQSTGGAAPSGDIMIRGRNSILANNGPLIVLDGVPFNGELIDINVSDVESMEVLKDASSAAIYGSRGANGVILITTKKGASGKARISYDGKYSSQQAAIMPRYMSAEEFYEFKEIREPGTLTASEREIYESGEWVDWAKLALRNGNSQQHNLAVSGATENVSYYLSGNYLKVNGQTINNSFERISSRVNVEVKIGKLFKVGTNTQMTFDDKGGALLSWEDIFRTNPLTRAYDENGELTIYPWEEFIDIGNPLEPLNYDQLDKSFQVISNNYLNFSIPSVPGLNYRLNTGIRKRMDETSTYRGRNTLAGLGDLGNYNSSNPRDNNTLIENILSYDKSFGKSSIFLTAVYSYEENKNTSDLLEARGFPNDFLGATLPARRT